MLVNFNFCTASWEQNRRSCPRATPLPRAARTNVGMGKVRLGTGWVGERQEAAPRELMGQEALERTEVPLFLLEGWVWKVSSISWSWTLNDLWCRLIFSVEHRGLQSQARAIM